MRVQFIAAELDARVERRRICNCEVEISQLVYRGDDYISKPISLHELDRPIRDLETSNFRNSVSIA